MKKDTKKIKEYWLSKKGIKKSINNLMSTITFAISSEHVDHDSWTDVKTRACPTNEGVALLQTSYFSIAGIDSWMTDQALAQDTDSSFDNWSTRNSRFRSMLDFLYSYYSIFQEIINATSLPHGKAFQKTYSSVMNELTKLRFIRKLYIHPTSIYIGEADFNLAYNDKVKPRMFFTNFIKEKSKINLFLRKKNLKKLLGGTLKAVHVYLADDYVGIDLLKNPDDKYETKFKCKLFVPVGGNLEMLFLSFDEEDFYETFFDVFKRSIPLLEISIRRTYVDE